MREHEHDHNHDHEHDHEAFSLEDFSADLQTLDFTIENGVAILTLDHEESRNALSGQALYELGMALELAQSDLQIQALVLTGQGDVFSSGAHISELSRVEGGFHARETALAGQEVMHSLASLPMPTIAALNGVTLGGGLELALAADLRVAARDALLGLPEVGLGLIPGFGATQRLPRLIGLGRALDLIFTARQIEADEALQLGLVNRVAEDALAEAMRLAKQMTANAPVALGLAKEAVVRGLDLGLMQGLEVEADLFGLALSTEDAKEGMRAFLDKREANFSGQ